MMKPTNSTIEVRFLPVHHQNMAFNLMHTTDARVGEFFQKLEDVDLVPAAEMVSQGLKKDFIRLLCHEG